MGKENDPRISNSESDIQGSSELVIFPPKYETYNSLNHPESAWLGLSRTAVGEGYLGYYDTYLSKLIELGISGDKMDAETLGTLRDEVAEKLFDDLYNENGRAFVATQLMSQNGHPGKNLSASARVVKGKRLPDQDLAPLESMELAVPDIKGGWNSFLGRRSLDKTCELSRAVIPKEFRDQGMTTHIVKEFIDGEYGVRHISEQLGMKHMIMIAQRKFAKHMEKTSLKFRGPIPIRLTPTGEEVARIFPGYWKDPQDPPMLYIASIRPV